MPFFRFSLQDNDSYAFREYPLLTEDQKIHQGILPVTSGKSRSYVVRCNACGELLRKWEEPLTGLVVKKRNYDIAVTYDGITVASTRFKLCYESAALTGLAFTQLPNDSDFFAIRPLTSVAFDAERRKTRFIKPCPQCNHFESVVGATSIYLKAGSSIDPRQFVRTDMEFGSNDEKSPLLLCGEVATKALKAAKLKGVDLFPIDTPATLRPPASSD